jgi:hypothetical protein
MKSVKRTAEKMRIGPVFFSRPLHGLEPLQLLIPAVNCWATVIRPLCGLINSFFGQGRQQALSCRYQQLLRTRRTEAVGFVGEIALGKIYN